MPNCARSTWYFEERVQWSANAASSRLAHAERRLEDGSTARVRHRDEISRVTLEVMWMCGSKMRVGVRPYHSPWNGLRAPVRTSPGSCEEPAATEAILLESF